MRSVRGLDKGDVDLLVLAEDGTERWKMGKLRSGGKHSSLEGMRVGFQFGLSRLGASPPTEPCASGG